jgi:putative DNA methylase
MKIPQKLIEVALPLDDINIACAHEKMPGIGAHPRGIHHWWARRPLAAARAVIFAQMVNDPGYERYLNRGVNKEKAAVERERLFDIMRDLVKWENTNNEKVLNQAREEIWKSWRETCALNKDDPQAKELFNPEKLPAFHDPFAGGGAIPLEAQRLGLEAWASDLNPVAVTINKAMIEIPPKFVDRTPIGPLPNKERAVALLSDWKGISGFAEDFRRYGHWIHEQAKATLSDLYPRIKVTKALAKERPELKSLEGEELTVIAWLWARTVKCPNPACGCEMPLLTSYILSSKAGREKYLKVDYEKSKGLIFDVVSKKTDIKGEPSKGLKRGTSGIFECVNCGAVTTRDYTSEQAKKVGLGSVQTAVVCDSKRGRIYLPAKYGMLPQTELMPDTSGLSVELAANPRDVWCRNFGLNTTKDLFTKRQLIALTTISGLIQKAHKLIKKDAIAAGLPDDALGLNSGGTGATAYADAISIYLAFAVDRAADFNNSITGWRPGNEKLMNLFSRQTIPMVWDYAEANIMAEVVGGFTTLVDYQAKCLTTLPAKGVGFAIQGNASDSVTSKSKIVSTDPPYYDNIGYADLSDFFYVWLRRSLKPVFPELFSTVSVPKSEELVALAYRHENKDMAEEFFLNGMSKAVHGIAIQSHPAFPVTIYYAFKQAESSDNGVASTGWETFLEAVLKAGFAVTGTWPMRSEQSSRMIGIGTNALASSIVLVCRQRDSSAQIVSRREFVRELNSVLPEAIDDMTRGAVNSPVAPVDLSQAIIGPGMAIFSKYSAVLEADGKPMTVRTALQLINRFLAEDDFDHDTQFCLHWLETVGWSEGKFGEADVLARAKGTSVTGLTEAGVISSGSGIVRLLKWSEYPSDWSPEKDSRLPIWEALHQLIRALRTGGETAAGVLVTGLGARIEAVRQLAYRLYTLCERKGWSEDARAYNELVASWQAIEDVAPKKKEEEKQAELF